MIEDKTLYQAIEMAAHKHPHNLAMYYKGKKISYRKMLKRIDRMANILVHQIGVEKDDVVLIAQPNIPDVITLVYAVNKIGAICNLVHPFTPYNQIEKIMRQTNTKVAFIFEQRVAKEVEKYREIADKIYVTRVEDDLPLIKKFVYHNFMNRAIRKKLGKFRGSFKGFKYMRDLKATRQPVEVVTDKFEKMSVLLHSGSTTGDPKTICLSDQKFEYICDQSYKILCCKPEEMSNGGFLTVLPSFHGFGLCMCMHAPLCWGSSLIMMPKFNNDEASKSMAKVKTICIIGVPTMFENMLKSEHFQKNKKLKSLIACYCGGDTMSISLKKRFDEVMIRHGARARLYQGYGLTEAIAVNCVNTHEHHKDNTIGYPLEGAEFAIFSPEDKKLGPNEVGEICLKSGAVMLGYYNDEEATKATFNKDGWLKTGDLGYIDEDGFIYFNQRKKRVVKVSGVGVFPTEIEHLVESVPGVEAVCAIRIPDPKLQSAIKLFVVAKYFDEVGMKNLILDTCRKYLIRWAVPKEIEFIKELPYTLYNKVDFRKLQEQEDAKRGITHEK